jgi:hypothetical protein
MNMIKYQLIILITLIGFILNLPFGYLRSKSKKYSIAWFSYIHLPILFVVFLRLITHTSYIYIPLFFAASIIGQILGSYSKLQIK